MPLVDWSERDRSLQDVAGELRDQLATIPGARISVWGGNSLNIRGGGGDLEVALLGNNYDEIFAAAKIFVAAIEEQLPELTRPRIAF